MTEPIERGTIVIKNKVIPVVDRRFDVTCCDCDAQLEFGVDDVRICTGRRLNTVYQTLTTPSDTKGFMETMSHALGWSTGDRVDPEAVGPIPVQTQDEVECDDFLLSLYITCPICINEINTQTAIPLWMANKLHLFQSGPKYV